MHSVRMAKWKKKSFCPHLPPLWNNNFRRQKLESTNSISLFGEVKHFIWNVLATAGDFSRFSLLLLAREKKNRIIYVCLIQTRRKKNKGRIKLPNKLSFIGKRYYSSSVMDLVRTHFLICAKVGVGFYGIRMFIAHSCNMIEMCEIRHTK